MRNPLFGQAVKLSWQQVAVQAMVVAVGVAFSVLAYAIALREDSRRIEELFASKAEWRAIDLAGKISKPAETVAHIATTFQALDDLEILSFDRALIGRYRTIGVARLFSWAPRVSAAERATFERMLKDFGIGDFSILDLDPTGSTTPAQYRAEHYPAARFWVLDGPALPTGLDYAGNPVLSAAIERARNTGTAVLSEPIISRYTSLGTLIYISPVYHGAEVPPTIAERRAKFRGVVTGAVVFEELLNKSIVDTPRIIETIYIGIGRADDDTLFESIVQYDPGTERFRTHVGTIDRKTLQGYNFVIPLKVSDRTIQALFHFSPELADGFRAPTLWIWIAGGLVVTALIVLILNQEMLQTVRAHHAVSAATEKLRRQYRRDNAVVQALGQVAYEWNPRNAEITWSGNISGMLGFEISELGRRYDDWADRVHPDDRPKTLDLINAAVKAKRSYDVEYRFRRHDGLYLWVRHIGVPLLEAGGRLERIVGVLSDISERRRLRDQLAHSQRMDAIGQLTGGIAHDFNNLLGVIIAHLELVLEQIEDDEQLSKPVEAALNSAFSGGKLIKQLLAFSRRQLLETTVVDVSACLHDMVPLLKSTLGAHIEIILRSPNSLWPIVTDVAQLESAILNLVINARDAMPEGGTIAIETVNCHLDADYVALHADANLGDYVMISVTDSGAGMTPDVAGRALEPFYTTKPDGTGLGLAMVYGFVRQSGGHLSLYSEPGHGSTVRLYFPAAKSAQPTATSETSAPVVRTSAEVTVLVVEDRADLRAAAIAVLRRLGYQTLEAESGAAALAIVRAGTKIDLVFTDILMPGGMSGLDLVNEIRALGKDIPVLLTTGYASPHMLREQAMKLGLPMIVKPYRIAELAMKINLALKLTD